MMILDRGVIVGYIASMFMRFHRSKKLAPGVRLNVSKHGLGLSIGPRGLHTSLNSQGVRTTISAPGTGLSLIEQRSWGKVAGKAQGSLQAGNRPPRWKVILAKLIARTIVLIPVLLMLLVGMAAMAFGMVILWAIATNA